MAQTAGSAPPALGTIVATRVDASPDAGFDGVVEAVRQSVLSAQVAGAVVQMDVRAGDRVRAGQVLLRLDARAAQQQAGAASAQVQAARAARDAATRDFERQKTLFQKNYISQAALDRAEAQYKAAQAETAAQLASAEAARTQSGFYVITAPYAGTVAQVQAVLGDMVMPGRPLVTLYDPAVLRVSADVPESSAEGLGPDRPVMLDVAGAAAPIRAARVEALPAVDPATHTRELRLELPAGSGALPGSFARVHLPAAGSSTTTVAVPARAIVRRAELTALYVVGPDGLPLLRQVRLGRPLGERVEILSGLAVGERVAIDPQAAARIR